MSQHHRRPLLALPVLALAAWTGGAPAPAPDAVPASLAAEIDQFLAGTPSELERRVLEDHRVTDAELHEAQEAFTRCAADAGYDAIFSADTFELLPSDGRDVPAGEEQAELDARSQVSDTCSTGTTDFVGYVYGSMRDNPHGLTYAQQVRECFTRHGVTEGDGLDDDALERLVRSDDGGPQDPQARACAFDPTGRLSPEDLGEEVEETIDVTVPE